MKRVLFALLLIVLFLTGCSGGNEEVKIVDTIDTGYSTYHQMSDGTWEADGISYQYRLEITGRMPNAVKDSTFVYLSNIENITFEQAWKAAGLSSHLDDYFSAEDAILVEWK